jgi:MFS family permease
MLDTYRRVLAHPGAVGFSASGFVGRLPISMVGLGIVLLVSGRSGSYSLAGSVSAACILAEAVCAIAQGRLIDRLGQGRFLPWAITSFAISMALLMWAVQGVWPLPLPHVVAAMAGASLPPVGSCVRARWAHLLDNPDEMHTAYSLEAVLDETVFVLGPTAVTLLATSWHPLAGLTTAVVAGVAGTLALAAQRGTQPPANPRPLDRSVGPRIPWEVMAPLSVVGAALGVLFGSAEVATVALSEELGHKAWSGLLLAVWAFGSLLSGLISGAMTWHSSTTTRIRVGTAALTLLMAPLVLVHSFALLAPFLFLAGFAIAPTLIATMSLVEQVLPKARLTEGLSLLLGGIADGVAAGAPLAGVVIDHIGPSESYGVTVAGGLLGATAALFIGADPAGVHTKERQRRM